MILPKMKMAVNRAVNVYLSGAAKRMQEKIEKKINANDSKSSAKLGTEEIKKSDLAFLDHGLKKDPYTFIYECLKKANDSDKIIGTKKDLDVKLEDLTGDIKFAKCNKNNRDTSHEVSLLFLDVIVYIEDLLS